MSDTSRLRIGITCYPLVGGSGVLASALGEELARRGDEVHFITHERPFRLPAEAPNLHFHPVPLLQQGPFKYPDYTFALAVKIAEVSREHRLDLIHAHYAIPHAVAAIWGAALLAPDDRPKVVATLHGTDTTWLGREPSYAPVLRHALTECDGVTAVSDYLRRETRWVLQLEGLERIHNFFEPRLPTRTPADVREELGIGDAKLIVHLSNLRPVKRIDLLLRTLARVHSRTDFRLLVLAGEPWAPFEPLVRELGLEGRVLVRENVAAVEDYLQTADLGLFTSASESFCLSILEAMAVGCPSVSTRVGGIPEVVESGKQGVLVDSTDPAVIAREVSALLDDDERRLRLGAAARTRAREKFSADAIVPLYEAFYQRVCAGSQNAATTVRAPT
ncbi:MAG TPA: N-acetyl-alpha-D-glucosaminyl L-malate synthase BshA [Candidatus Synoicihabitans sp.]|nr:N-acetyl-alpha-D-glucosaminyl L-malate synthase BshA [Candidatus Synoicihabitans sp.]